MVYAIQFKTQGNLSYPLACNILKSIKAYGTGPLAGFKKWFVFQTSSRNTEFKQKKAFLTLCPFTVMKGLITINSHIYLDSDLIVPSNLSRSKVMLFKNNSNFSSCFTKRTAFSVAISLHKSSGRGLWVAFVFFFFFAIARWFMRNRNLEIT